MKRFGRSRQSHVAELDVPECVRCRVEPERAVDVHASVTFLSRCEREANVVRSCLCGLGHAEAVPGPKCVVEQDVGVGRVQDLDTSAVFRETRLDELLSRRHCCERLRRSRGRVREYEESRDPRRAAIERAFKHKPVDRRGVRLAGHDRREQTGAGLLPYRRRGRRVRPPRAPGLVGDADRG